MKPSGVQLADAETTSRRHTRTSSAAAREWSALNITPMADSTRSKDPSPMGQRLGVGLGEVDREVLRLRAPTGDVEQGGHVVDAGGGRPPAGRREGDVPGAGRDVEDAGAGCDADVLDEVLGHRHVRAAMRL